MHAPCLEDLLHQHYHAIGCGGSTALQIAVEARPEEITAGEEAQEPDQGHPDVSHDMMKSALGEGTDVAPASMIPTAAQEGVEAEGEGG